MWAQHRLARTDNISATQMTMNVVGHFEPENMRMGHEKWRAWNCERTTVDAIAAGSSELRDDAIWAPVELRANGCSRNAADLTTWDLQLHLREDAGAWPHDGCDKQGV
ncbi:hypothetical protein SUNI508_00805 [Seiridium unicorne]|uniref:Uncharacterized protein n=1 Tax=Seiridium unicorne TaxID=138068 RepID=A0ABR2V1M5_9PEZI